MHVRKRNGSLEAVNLSKIVNSLERYCSDLPNVDIYRIATKTVGGLVDGVSTRELDMFSVRTAKDLIIDDPVYSRVAARILANVIQKEVSGQDIHSFSQSIECGLNQGLISPATHALAIANRRKLNAAIRPERDWNMEYHGLQTVYDRYLLKHRTLIAFDKQRAVIETPQYFFMRVACGLANDANEAIEFYNLLSSLEYMVSTPTLFNSGTVNSQCSSCYLNDSPIDSLDDIYKRYSDIALLSKFAGGIGVSLSRLRGKGSLIRGTNGTSNGLVPWAHTLSASVGTVNQCLHPETLVYTSNGLKPIRNIEANVDLVLGLSGYYRPVQEVLRYPASTERSIAIKVRHGGRPIVVTDGHPIYAITGIPTEISYSDIYAKLEKGIWRPAWVEAGQLHRGDFVAIPVPKQIEIVDGFDADDAFFFGLMLGDGHMSRKKNSNSIECGLSYHPGTKKAENAAWLQDYLHARGVHTWTTDTRENYGQIGWTFSEAMPFAYDDLYDQEDNKRIATRFTHLPIDQTVRMIQGLVATDGNISRGKEITFTNSSKPLVDGLRYQLIRLSVMSAEQNRQRADERVLVRADGSETVMRYDNEYSDVRIPAFEELAIALNVPAVTKSHWLTYGGMVWSRIKKVEKAETADEVYDLRVEFDETYTVQGALVHNGGKRKGAACVYLETHHPDLMQFLELKDNTGEKEQRGYNLNLANWISDLFMKRVRDDALWSFFDPTVAPELNDLYGDAYEARYVQLEAEGKYSDQIPARKVYQRMMRTLAETGNGWMCFKDACNRRGNQVNEEAGTMIHLSNLCVAPETLILTDKGELPISSLRDQAVNIWNGEEWSTVVVRQTGEHKPLLHVILRNGTTIDCTPYHRFYLTNGLIYTASELKPGDELPTVSPSLEQSTTQVVEVQDLLRNADTYCFMEPKRHQGVFNGILAGNCTEILEVTSSGTRKTMARDDIMKLSADEMIENNIHVVGFSLEKDQFEVMEGVECAVCNLGSINIGRGYVKNGKLDKDKLRKNVAIAVRYLDRVIDRNFYPIPEARASNLRWRPVGLGLMGLADFFFQLRIPFDSDEAIRLSGEIQEEVYYQALRTSCELAQTLGAHRDFHLTRAAKGQLQFDLAGVTPKDQERWESLRQDIIQHGLRNSLLIAVAPTATISHICGVEECIEPIKSNLLKRETLSGEFISVNKYLVEDLRKIGRWTPDTIAQLKVNEGSIATIPDLPHEMYAIYKTVWEMSMRPIIAHGVARGAFIDQSHSLNMFIDLNRYPESKRIGVLSSLYMHAWESGVKTTYYFRSRAATRIEQTTTRMATLTMNMPTAAETPEVCESCT